jgi:hypothetical protein
MKGIKFASVMMASAAAVALGATSASAFTVNIGGTQVAGEGYKSSVAGAQTIDFNSGSAPTSGFASYSPLSNHVVQGSVFENHGAPAGDNTPYLTVARSGANANGATGSVSINFAEAIDYFGMYWGSVDASNTVQFFMGETLVGTFRGTDVSTTASGSWSGSSDNVFVNFFADQGEYFDRIVLSTENIAFESDNHAYRLDTRSSGAPEPITIGGTLVAAAMGWRMKKKKQQASA